jgi:hypothetical protein
MRVAVERSARQVDAISERFRNGASPGTGALAVNQERFLQRAADELQPKARMIIESTTEALMRSSHTIRGEDGVEIDPAADAAAAAEAPATPTNS